MITTTARKEAADVIASLLDDLTCARRLACVAADKEEVARGSALGYGPAVCDPDTCGGHDTSLAEARLVSYVAWSQKTDDARLRAIRARRPLLALCRVACRPRERRVIERYTLAPAPVSVEDVSKDTRISVREMRRLESSGLRRMESAFAELIARRRAGRV
jgi:hypothetical protein